MSTKIEWCDETWNPVRTADGGYHCTKVSPGCDYCWAENFNNRIGNHRLFDDSPADFVINERAVHKMFHWREPRRIFVQDMGDIGHEGIPDSLVTRVLGVICQTIWHRIQDRVGQHTLILLTKRPAKLRERLAQLPEPMRREIGPHLEIGATAENQELANSRIRELFKIAGLFNYHDRPRLFACLEPMLGPIDLTPFLAHKWMCSGCGHRTSGHVGGCKGYCQDSTGQSCDAVPCPKCGKDHYWTGGMQSLDGVIVGGERGPRALDPAWVRGVRDQCVETGTPFFFKGWGRTVPSMGDCLGDPPEGFKPGHVFLTDPKRLIDGREWNELPGTRGR